MAKEPDIVTELVTRFTASFRTMLLDVYAAGVTAGEVSADASGLKRLSAIQGDLQDLMALLDEKRSGASSKAQTKRKIAGSVVKTNRAPRGTAEAIVLTALHQLPHAATAVEVFQHLGGEELSPLKYNTVRGTLYRMLDQKVRRMGGRWEAIGREKKSPPPAKADDGDE